MPIQFGPNFAQSLLSGAQIGQNIALRGRQADLQDQQEAIRQKMLPLQLQALQDAHKQSLMKTDGGAQANYIINYLNAMHQRQAQQHAQQQASPAMPNVPMPAQSELVRPDQYLNHMASLIQQSGAAGGQPQSQAVPIPMRPAISTQSPAISTQQQTQPPVSLQQMVTQQRPVSQMQSPQMPARPQLPGGLSPDDYQALALIGKAPKVAPMDPYTKEQMDYQNKSLLQQQKGQIESQVAKEKILDASDQKRLDTLREALPYSNELAHRIDRTIKFVKEHPNLFGPGYLGFQSLGGSSYTQNVRLRDHPELRAGYKEVTRTLGDLQAEKAKQYSGSKALATAFNLAKQSKATPDDYPEGIVNVLSGAYKALTPAIQSESAWYKHHSSEELPYGEEKPKSLLPAISKVKAMPDGSYRYLRGDKWSTQ